IRLQEDHLRYKGIGPQIRLELQFKERLLRLDASRQVVLFRLGEPGAFESFRLPQARYLCRPLFLKILVETEQRTDHDGDDRQPSGHRFTKLLKLALLRVHHASPSIKGAS